MEDRKIDSEMIREATRMFLTAIGEDPAREGLRETPDRVARMCEEIFEGIGQDATEILSKQFSAGPGTEHGMVVEKDISFYSVCEHHLLPFFGKAAIGYIPGDKVVGLSKLARTVELYSKKPQIQERLTEEIANALSEALKTEDVIVVMEAEHTCMTMRGVKKPGSKTITIASHGIFKKDSAMESRFLHLIGD